MTYRQSFDHLGNPIYRKQKPARHGMWCTLGVLFFTAAVAYWRF